MVQVFWTLLIASLIAAERVEIQVVNQCAQDLWLGTKNLPIASTEAPVLKQGDQMTITTEINKDLSGGSLWARTDCSDEKVFMDCWKDLGMDMPCQNGTYYYCRDNMINDPYQCREHGQGPYPPQFCTDQCVITKSYQPGFLTSLEPKATKQESLRVKSFGCVTGNCVIEAESQRVCSETSVLTSPATLAEFTFGNEEDAYRISLAEGFNVNLTVEGVACKARSCKMNPWTQCQGELVDLDLATSQPFCWSTKSKGTRTSRNWMWTPRLDEESTLKFQQACPDATGRTSCPHQRSTAQYKVTFC
mmetsp:Transcript_72764/g.115546  ORF Transcript_72764/g.115546 Transcript_72764/m.115546 type:complete len:304 (-) Transcript_72764:164-1075(-)